MVAEKPSIAKAISEALAKDPSRIRQNKGISRFCPVHEFPGEIFGEKAYFRVTSVAGHVFSRDFPSKYSNWDTVDPLDLYDAETTKKESNPDSHIVEHLANEARDCTFLILWLDNDREGENICFEVKDTCEPVLLKLKDSDPIRLPSAQRLQVYRAKFSSITKPDLRQAFKNLQYGPNYEESISVDARFEIDLKIGVAFSRFLSLYFSRKYPDLKEKMITYGPCQTPTLGFCVARADEIAQFKPKLQFSLCLVLKSKENKEVRAEWEGGILNTENEAAKILNLVQ